MSLSVVLLHLLLIELLVILHTETSLSLNVAVVLDQQIQALQVLFVSVYKNEICLDTALLTLSIYLRHNHQVILNDILL